MFELDWVEEFGHSRVLWDMCGVDSHKQEGRSCHCFWDAYLQTLRDCDIDMIKFDYYGAWESIDPCDIIVIEAQAGDELL